MFTCSTAAVSRSVFHLTASRISTIFSWHMPTVRGVSQHDRHPGKTVTYLQPPARRGIHLVPFADITLSTARRDLVKGLIRGLE